MTSKNHFYIKGDEENLTDYVKQNHGLCVLFISQEGCPACKRAKQLLPNIYTENPDINFLEGSLETCASLLGYLGVQQVPVFIFFKGLNDDGKPKELSRQLGFDPTLFKQKIVQYA